MRVGQTRPLHPIRSAAEALRKRLVSWRRHLHMHPEPSGGEVGTARFVAQELRRLGIGGIRTGVGGHGVVGLVGRRKGRLAVALRADMDALELTEATGAPYASRVRGMMHACGHDGHVACLLGAAAILHERREALPGAVKLLFQPAEEAGGGAREMIRDGCLVHPRVRAVAGLHLFPDLASGAVGIRRGIYTAQSDSVRIVVRGRGTHAARPHKGVDPIAAAAHLITAIHTFLDRRLDPLEPRVLTIGLLRGGTRVNIVAEEVTLEGTLRTLSPAARRAVVRFLKTDLRRIARAFGATVQTTIHDGYPPLKNDERIVDCIERAAVAMFGRGGTRSVPAPSLGGEDFAFYGVLGGIPTAMCRLGVRDVKKGFVAPLHSTRFDFDDGKVLPVGAALMAQTALEMLAAAGDGDG